MAWLASFLLPLFMNLLGFFANYFARNLAYRAAAIAFMLAITATFYAAMKLLVFGIMYAITDEWILMGFWLLWPSNGELCISAVFGAELAAYMYRWQVRIWGMDIDTGLTLAPK